MRIEQIAIRIEHRRDPRPTDVHLSHPYRHRWWLPVIGPTATVLLDHLADTETGEWQVHDTMELSAILGLGPKLGFHSPLIRSFCRLTRFGFGRFDIEPDHPESSPCITLWSSIGPVPNRLVNKWPESLQTAHALDIVDLQQQAA